MDLGETLDPGVATVMSTGVKNLLHRISKVEQYASMSVVTRYLKETYSDAFNYIHALNQDSSTTKLVDAIWEPLGAAADANADHPGSLQGLENEDRLLQFCLQGPGPSGPGHKKLLPHYTEGDYTDTSESSENGRTTGDVHIAEFAAILVDATKPWGGHNSAILQHLASAKMRTKVLQLLTAMDVGFTTTTTSSRLAIAPPTTEAGTTAEALAEYLATTKTESEKSQVKSGHMADEERLVAFLDRCGFKIKLLNLFSTDNPKDAPLRRLILGMNVIDGNDAGSAIKLAAVIRGFLLIKTRAPHSIATGVMQDLAQVHERVCHSMEASVTAFMGAFCTTEWHKTTVQYFVDLTRTPMNFRKFPGPNALLATAFCYVLNGSDNKGLFKGTDIARLDEIEAMYIKFFQILNIRDPVAFSPNRAKHFVANLRGSVSGAMAAACNLPDPIKNLVGVLYIAQPSLSLVLEQLESLRARTMGQDAAVTHQEQESFIKSVGLSTLQDVSEDEDELQDLLDQQEGPAVQPPTIDVTESSVVMVDFMPDVVTLTHGHDIADVPPKWKSERRILDKYRENLQDMVSCHKIEDKFGPITSRSSIQLKALGNTVEFVAGDCIFIIPTVDCTDAAAMQRVGQSPLLFQDSAYSYYGGTQMGGKPIRHFPTRKHPLTESDGGERAKGGTKKKKKEDGRKASPQKQNPVSPRNGSGTEQEMATRKQSTRPGGLTPGEAGQIETAMIVHGKLYSAASDPESKANKKKKWPFTKVWPDLDGKKQVCRRSVYGAMLDCDHVVVNHGHVVVNHGCRAPLVDGVRLCDNPHLFEPTHPPTQGDKKGAWIKDPAKDEKPPALDPADTVPLALVKAVRQILAGEIAPFDHDKCFCARHQVSMSEPTEDITFQQGLDRAKAFYKELQ